MESRTDKVKQTMIDIYNQIESRKENDAVLSNVTYYKEFNFESVGLMDRNIFVTELKKGEGKDSKEVYEIYNENSELIATVDEKGKINFAPEYLEQLREVAPQYFETLRLEDTQFLLPQELGKEDVSLTQESLEEESNKLKIENVEELMEDEDIKSYSEADVSQKLFEKLTSKQEMDANVRVTQTETLADMIPDIKEKGFVKIGVVYSDKIQGGSGRFSFVGIDASGNVELVDGLENIAGTTTGQKVTSINSVDGSSIEEEQVTGMVRINGRNSLNGEEEYLSVTVGQYGILEVDYVRADLGADKEKRFFSAPIETQSIQPTTREVRDFMDKSKNPEIADKQEKAKPEVKRNEEAKVRNIDDNASNDVLDFDTVIVLENGEETSIRKEAAKAKVSPQEFLEKYEKYGGKTPDEIIDNVHDEIEEEFRGNNTRPR